MDQEEDQAYYQPDDWERVEDALEESSQFSYPVRSVAFCLETTGPSTTQFIPFGNDATSYTEKQGFLNTVYMRFFQGYAPKEADTHGIVYTPQPIVNFMVRSVEEILQKEFGRSLGTNDPNREDDREYILRLIGQVITVSLETVSIVKALPRLVISDADVASSRGPQA